jgi:threonine dehydratase
MFEHLKSSAVVEAAGRIAPHIRRTRLVRSSELSRLAGGDVYLKLENEQITGSFKLRGALNSLSILSEAQRERGVVASSAGNHGMGVAYAGKTLGVKAKVYVPRTAPDVKKTGIRSLGAELDDSQPDYDAAMDVAKSFAKSTAREFINPCLGDSLLAGQGTVALEVLEDLPDLRSFIVNVGGGGLLGGCASFLRHEASHVRIHGAQSVNTAAMARSLAARQIVEIPSVPTLADGLAGQIDDDAFDIGKHALDEIATVSEEEIARAIRWLSREHQVRAEGAGACGVAAILAAKVRPRTPCAIVVSGGNIDDTRWSEVLKME